MYMHSCCSQNPTKSQSLLLSFKPRQVLLQQIKNKPITKNTTNNTNMMINNNNNDTLNTQQNSLLLSSVLCYLNTNNSFSKPVQRLVSAANFKDDSWKTCSLNLEDMFKHYLETSSIANGTKKEADEAVVKQKKKTSDVTNNISVVAEAAELKAKTKIQKDSDSVEEVTKDAITEQKEKKKKSKKQSSEPVESKVESKEEVKSKDKTKKSKAKADGIDDAEEKTKDKKKKKKNPGVDAEKKEKVETVPSIDKKGEKEDVDVANKEGVKKDQKESKKRKRSDSDDNQMGTPLTNGNHDVKEGEFTANKSRRKENNGSTELKTVTAFQRVKADEVTFADERLQDNSYWAKDGADVGYGAKAQEVLGQVRGKDFRHEKTKKKRGSYRGGQIDLNSRSVKFNYGDEDEE